MIRTLCLPVLVLAVTGAAVFRLEAEQRVRVEQHELARLERQAQSLRAEIERLRFEVDVLESAPRLKELSLGRLPLEPGSAHQLADGETLRHVIDPAASLESRP